jgi:hypothetical protein
VIALGDVPVARKEIAVTHIRHAFVKANRPADGLNQFLADLQALASLRQGVFDRHGRPDLRHGAGGQFPAGLNARSL